MQHRSLSLAKIAYKCIRDNPGVIVMAGSMPLWLRQGAPLTWFPNDVDLFWYGGKWQTLDKTSLPETTHKMFRCTPDTCFVFPIDVDNKTYCVSFIYGIRPYVRTIKTHNGNLQFILSSHFETISDVLGSFDLTCCRIASTETNSYEILDGFSTDSFKMLVCSAETVCQTGGTGSPTDLAQLALFQAERTAARARKYEARGLKNCGSADGSAAVLTFCLLYKNPRCAKFEHRLDELGYQDIRALCTCQKDCFITDESSGPYTVAASNNGKIDPTCV